MGQQPYNFLWIDKTLAASGWPQTKEHLEFLKNQGINHLVTLSPEQLPPVDKINRIKWTIIPIEEFEAPSLEDISKFMDIVETCESNNEAVCVHCRAGRGRTGTMIACYFLQKDLLSPETAITKIRLLRPGSVETYAQEKAVRLYHDYLRSK